MIAGLFLAAGLALSTMVATSAWLKVKNSQFITVKGSVQKHVESDLIVWSGSYQVEAPTLLDAQRDAKAKRVIVETFLAGAGIANPAFSPIDIAEQKAAKKMEDGFVNQYTTGYRLSQTVTVKSPDLDRLDKLDTTPLLEQGVRFTTFSPQFIYTRAGEAKIEMLAEATKDARARAGQIAAQGARDIACLQSADQGIFQITPQHTVAASWGGESDTTSRYKTITAVVTATFLMK